MKVNKLYSCDVLVIGSGLAGIQSAITAEKNGSNVILVSNGEIFSGSSFYKGTWGLGLIAPENKQDEKNLANQIKAVGCDMATDEMVDSFVSGIQPAINNLIYMGLQLKQAENKHEKDFIPCFDCKHRNWYGILQENAKEIFARYLCDVTLLDKTVLLKIVKHDDKVVGAVFSNKGKIFFIESKATIIATGGFSGMFKQKLTSSDVTSIGQILAVECGAKLVNIEFMQMMPAYLKPMYGTVFNEKAFRYTYLYDENGSQIDISDDILTLRGTHGPFTSRLKSCIVDFTFSDNPATVKYNDKIRENTPEFIKTYFDWLKKAKNLTIDDEITISSFAHASNGGIVIDENAFTGINGLYACGEATGGMHGADRIGGLSTANGLVFGQRAGQNASEYAKNTDFIEKENIFIDDIGFLQNDEIINNIKSIMQKYCMISKNAEGLKTAIDEINKLESYEKQKITDNYLLTRSIIAEKQLYTAKCILKAVNLRQESRGSHYRSDFPCQSEIAKQILVDLNGVYYKN